MPFAYYLFNFIGLLWETTRAEGVSMWICVCVVCVCVCVFVWSLGKDVRSNMPCQEFPPLPSLTTHTHTTTTIYLPHLKIQQHYSSPPPPPSSFNHMSDKMHGWVGKPLPPDPSLFQKQPHIHKSSICFFILMFFFPEKMTKIFI